MRKTIRTLIESIPPYDSLEQEHIRQTIEWIDSGVQIFRMAKPATPPQHLVSYFILVDREERKLLLVDHIHASLWLPTGGHVEPDEHPQETVRRECREELGIEARLLLTDPFFLTVCETVGTTAGHVDVSLWYLLDGDATKPLEFDAGEFKEVRWFGFDEIPFDQSDPHMVRFVGKLKSKTALWD